MRDEDDMFNTGFDPYNALIELNDRLTRLERAHNKMANSYIKMERDFSIMMDSFQSLQKSHLALSKLIGLTVNPLK